MTNPEVQMHTPSRPTDQSDVVEAQTRLSQVENNHAGGGRSVDELTRPASNLTDAVDFDDSGSQSDTEHQPMQLLGEDDLQETLKRWREIQSGFVDEPRQAIDDADALVADLLQRLARGFAQERETLGARLRAGSDVSTEEMRQGLRRYRSFFERLLAA